jgi:hypothetical protein
MAENARMRFLSMAFCLVGCGSVQSNPDMMMMSGPCAGVTCSGHGTCMASGNTATCSCDTGYAAMGTKCIATTGPCAGVTCSNHGTCDATSGAAVCACDPGYIAGAGNTCTQSAGPTLSGCPMLPQNNIFNTPISTLPVDAHSTDYLNTIGVVNLHLDLGQQTDQTQTDFYGIPYNLVKGNTIPWVSAYYYSADTMLNWNPTDEADCGSGSSHSIVSPCTAASPIFPIPTAVIVEGGIDTDPSQPYGDHHILMLDTDNCRLWETYHSYPHGGTGPGWDIFGSATFDMTSNALRPAGWTSADAAGFPILPLLLRADEASSGTISHAIRFTIDSSKIRTSYIWPGRHLTGNGTSSTMLPPMGQLFRLKASYTIPSTYNVQSKAILKAMQTYGIYIADGGSDMYITGEPSANWMDTTFDEVQAVDSSYFEAVDITPIFSRAGYNADSGAVPPP